MEGDQSGNPSGNQGAPSPGPPSVAGTASRSRQDRTPGPSVLGTPASHHHDGASQQQLSAPNTGRRSSGVTPRPDLGGYVGFYQNPMSTGRRSSIALSESALGSDDMDDHEATYIWGTNLTVARVMQRFNAFIRGFCDNPGEEPKYMQLLQETRARGEMSFNIDGHHIYEFDPTLYNWTVSFPVETVPIFDYQLALIIAEVEGIDDPQEVGAMQCRIYNLRTTKVIRDLNPSDIDNLVAISGMVTRTSPIIPDQSLATFRCMKCSQEQVNRNDRGNIDEPAKCPNPQCQATFQMQLIYNCSSFMDKQLIKVQESPNHIPEGETPHTVSLFARQDLVDMAKPGDRVTIVGIYRGQPLRVNPRRREVKAVYKTYIDIMHIQKEESSSLFTLMADETQTQEEEFDAELGSQPAATQGGGDLAGLLNSSNLTREEVEAKREQFREIASDPDVYEKLAASLAPSVWQLEDVKKGLLCQLFGGVSKTIPGNKTRGEINVLLVGDPGVAKSQILSYVHKLAPRGIYTSGKGSSAVGLTAYVTKDPETKEMVLESGALVLSDRGVCCIDEFDKMSDASRSMLHEVMEQQTISVAKAGIIATLNARTSVLASANPVGSRYNPNLSVVENIQLPPSLMSRFDLIYLLLDKPNEVTDRRLARHLVALHGDPETLSNNAQAPIPLDVLREFIAYARASCQPNLPPAPAQMLATAYADMRAMGMSRKTVSATPRQLESLIRLAESLARMRLARSVSEADVEEAVRLMKVAMQQSSIDPRTGQIDMDIIQTGVSAADRTNRASMISELGKLLDGWNQGASVRLADLIDDLSGRAGFAVTERDLRGALAEMENVVQIRQGMVVRV